MAEILGTVASILQLLDTAAKTWEHIQDFLNAPKEEKQISLEMECLKAILERLRQEMITNPSCQWSQDMDKPLTMLKEMMEEFKSKLGVSTFRSQVKWSLGGKKEAAEYLAKFEQFKSLLNTWLLVDLGEISRQQKELLTILNDKQYAAERAQIIDWFSPVLPVLDREEPGAGYWWILASKSGRKDWGKPCGVVESRVRENRFWCLWLWTSSRQLVIGGRDISEVRTAYQKHLEKKTAPSLAEIENIVHSEIGISKVYIVVDAVDEYPEDLRQILLSALAAMGPTCNLMMTSRPHIIPGPAFLNIKFLEIYANMDDIQANVNMEIQKSPHLSKFLLAKLHMKALAKQYTATNIRTALDHLPRTLVETYTDAIRRIDAQSEEDKDIANEALSWVTNAKRVLSVAELRVALAIESGTQELDKENLTDIEKILSGGYSENKGQESASASARGHYDMVRLLANSGADMNAQGGKALQAAAWKGSKKVVQLLIDNGADVNAQGGKYGHALQAAAYMGHKKVMQLLIDHRADVNAQGGRYGKALQAAAFKGHREIIQLLTDHRADVNSQGGKYTNALQAAAYMGHKEVVQLLIDHRADVNAQGGRGQRPALRSSLCRGTRELIIQLLNSPSKQYSNALQAAAYKGHKEVAQLLIDYRADVNAHGGWYGNALQAAAHSGHKEVVQLLIDHRADVNTQGGKYGNHDALQAAAYMGHKEVMRLLVDHGANVKIQGGESSKDSETLKCGTAVHS
ncbi:ankyrin repeat-containing domain protein [Mycena filopes]|nr:ankyrin repeat-containing domain protein [Mycena filopes]